MVGVVNYSRTRPRVRLSVEDCGGSDLTGMELNIPKYGQAVASCSSDRPGLVRMWYWSISQDMNNVRSRTEGMSCRTEFLLSVLPQSSRTGSASGFLALELPIITRAVC
jgi:hypothetical protein